MAQSQDNTAASLPAIAGKLDLCIARTEVAAKHAERAADAAVACAKDMGEIRRVVQKQASDYAWLRHGIPASWAGRFALVGVAAIIGAMAALSAVACARPF